MSKLKKLGSLLLALVFALGLTCTAFASSDVTAEVEDEEYSITIEDAADGETYYAYKVFDVTYSGTAYSYTIDYNSPFFSVVDSSTIFTCTQVGDSTTYVVTYDKNVADAEILNVLSQAELTTADAAAYAVAEDGVAEIELDEAGYYYVTTTLGSVVMLDNADPTATITDKNGEPTVDKDVLEDSTSTYGNTNDADVGDTVTFKSTITDIKGAESLVLHDTMTNLTFKEVTSVTLNGNALAAGTDYNVVTTGLTDGRSFEVVFTDTFLATLTSDGTIVVTYTATVDAAAATKGAGNSTTVSYGNSGESESTPSTTTTYTYGFDIFKYTGTDTALEGAKFVLSKTVSDTTYYAVVANGVLTGWTTTEADATVLVSDVYGKISVDGLDAGEYTLTETEAPTGYNKLTSPITVTITGTKDETTGDLTGEYTVTVSTGASVSDGSVINVQNNTGSSLPSTGGIGTTIFYVVGGALVIGAVVLLITKKRMSE